MKIAFIGAGRLSTNLAPALQRAGCEVAEVWSRTQASAEALASRLNSDSVSAPHCQARWGRVRDVILDADLYLLSVTDSALKDVVRELHVGREHALFAHTAGSLPLSLFSEVGHERGAVFYPMQTFSKERQVDFRDVHFFVEANKSQDIERLCDLARHLTSAIHVHESSSVERRRLHLAAVFACNFANHCFALADEVLREAGLPFDAMMPLIKETVQKLHELPPAQAQTGPAVRRDENVIGMQRSMLLQQPDLLAVYDVLTRSIMNTSVHPNIHTSE